MEMCIVVMCSVQRTQPLRDLRSRPICTWTFFLVHLPNNDCPKHFSILEKLFIAKGLKCPSAPSRVIISSWVMFLNIASIEGMKDCLLLYFIVLYLHSSCTINTLK